MQLVKLITYYDGYYGGEYYEEIILSKEFIQFIIKPVKIIK